MRKHAFRLLIVLLVAIVTGLSMVNPLLPLPRIFLKTFVVKENTTAATSLRELRQLGRPFLPTKLSDEEFETLLTRLEKAGKTKKYIFRYFDNGFQPFLNTRWCGSCEVTTIPEMIHHPQTKAVVIDFQAFDEASRSPSLIDRRPDQLYVWITQESPASLRNMRNMTLESETRFQFNVTQTYRHDSGIYLPYGNIAGILLKKRREGVHKNISHILKKKDKLAVAIISNCGVTPGARTRLSIIRTMQELGLKVDTFGKCFGKRLKETRQDFDKRLGTYKFYFSFENAFHCREYITEKFLINGHRAGTVPIVLGGSEAEYEAVAPKGSFIFAENYSSISSLVDHLIYLDKHDEEYLKYFRWIEEGFSALPESRGATGMCRLCRMLHGINVDDAIDPRYTKSDLKRPQMFTNDIAPRTVKDLRKWFYDTENDDCFREDVLPITRIK